MGEHTTSAHVSLIDEAVLRVRDERARARRLRWLLSARVAAPIVVLAAIANAAGNCSALLRERGAPVAAEPAR